jgi:hypothetical protein
MRAPSGQSELERAKQDVYGSTRPMRCELLPQWPSPTWLRLFDQDPTGHGRSRREMRGRVVPSWSLRLFGTATSVSGETPRAARRKTSAGDPMAGGHRRSRPKGLTTSRVRRIPNGKRPDGSGARSIAKASNPVLVPNPRFSGGWQRGGNTAPTSDRKCACRRAPQNRRFAGQLTIAASHCKRWVLLVMKGSGVRVPASAF